MTDDYQTSGAEYIPEDINGVPASGRESARMLWAAGLRFACETRVVPDRRFRWDFKLLDYPIALEIDGGVQNHGPQNPSAHCSYSGYRSDRLKDALSMSERNHFVYRTTTDVATQRKITSLLIKHAQRMKDAQSPL